MHPDPVHREGGEQEEHGTLASASVGERPQAASAHLRWLRGGLAACRIDRLKPSGHTPYGQERQRRWTRQVVDNGQICPGLRECHARRFVRKFLCAKEIRARPWGG